jgi:hypothetical protein
MFLTELIDSIHIHFTETYIEYKSYKVTILTQRQWECYDIYTYHVTEMKICVSILSVLLSFVPFSLSIIMVGWFNSSLLAGYRFIIIRSHEHSKCMQWHKPRWLWNTLWSWRQKGTVYRFLSTCHKSLRGEEESWYSFINPLCAWELIESVKQVLPWFIPASAYRLFPYNM